MTPEELGAIIGRLRRQQDDDARVEAKACERKLSKDVWESVSAFGNTHGGILILGLGEESGFKPVEHFDVAAVRDAFVTGMGDGGRDNRALENSPQYEIERHEFEGKPLLVVEIEEVDPRYKPCFVISRDMKNGSFKRVDDKDVKLSPTEIFELQNALTDSGADKEIVREASLRDLDDKLVESFVAEAKRRDSKAVRGISDVQDQLARLNVLDNEGSVRLGGLLALGSYPQQYCPKCIVDVAVHPGLEKSDPDGPRFVDRMLCEGPLVEVIDDAIRATARNLRRYSFVSGKGREDELEIPREVLREALANAVIHREYGEHFLGQAVSVDVFPDRVEVTNPGGLWGGKTLDNLDDGSSRCRNPALMTILSFMEFPGEGGFPAEGNGTGIPLMIREMRSRALAPPRFKADFDKFTVVLGRGGAEMAENREWLRRIAPEGLHRHEEAVLVEARREGTVSVARLRAHLAFDSDEIRGILQRLEGRGLLERVDQDVYRIADAPDAFGSATSARMTKEDAKEIVVGLLERTGEANVHELAHALGRSVQTTRARLVELQEEGVIEATAASTSRHRAYRLAQRPR